MTQLFYLHGSDRREYVGHTIILCATSSLYLEPTLVIEEAYWEYRSDWSQMISVCRFLQRESCKSDRACVESIDQSGEHFHLNNSKSSKPMNTMS